MRGYAIARRAAPQHVVPTDNEATPPCSLCGSPHVGIGTEATLLLKGSWYISPEHGVEMFVLDPEVKLVTLELPNGQRVLVVDHNEAAETAHTDCVNRLAEEVDYLNEDDEFEDVEVIDDEDYEDD